MKCICISQHFQIGHKMNAICIFVRFKYSERMLWVCIHRAKYALIRWNYTLEKCCSRRIWTFHCMRHETKGLIASIPNECTFSDEMPMYIKIQISTIYHYNKTVQLSMVLTKEFLEIYVEYKLCTPSYNDGGFCLTWEKNKWLARSKNYLNCPRDRIYRWWTKASRWRQMLQ